MGKQSPARHRRRGSNLARAKENNQLDKRQCHQRHSHSRQSKISGAPSLPYFTRQLRTLIPDAISNGNGESLSHVRQIAKVLKRPPQRTQRKIKSLPCASL